MNCCWPCATNLQLETQSSSFKYSTTPAKSGTLLFLAVHVAVSVVHRHTALERWPVIAISRDCVPPCPPPRALISRRYAD